MGYTISWAPLRFSDFTYAGITDLLPKVISEDCKVTIGPNGFSIGNDENNRIYFPKDDPRWCWEKTNREPYGREAMKALILMVEYGVTVGLDHDDTDMTWFLEALDAVNIVWPLVTYEKQKKYFSELSEKKLSQQGLPCPPRPQGLPCPIQGTGPAAPASLSQTTTDTSPTETRPDEQTTPPTN